MSETEKPTQGLKTGFLRLQKKNVIYLRTCYVSDDTAGDRIDSSFIVLA